MWERIGSVDPPELVDARIQLHWAAQAVAGVGRTLHARRADDSQTSFTWSPAIDALVQEPFNGITTGLRLRDLTLLAIGKLATKLHLQGRTLDDAFAFIESQFATTLQRPGADLPDHPVSHGAPFGANEQHLGELARYYNNAALVLMDVARSDSRAGPVRCWPHHFDIATLLTFSGAGDPRTIGIGFSPGDGGSPEPYYYVTPWPSPDPSKLGRLNIGRWNTTGWTGAILPASRFAETKDPEGYVRAFITDATARSREALQ